VLEVKRNSKPVCVGLSIQWYVMQKTVDIERRAVISLGTNVIGLNLSPSANDVAGEEVNEGAAAGF
jgi:hypothetical protein